MNDLFSLEGEIAVVTGGAGKLGQEFSATLRTAGARVFSLDLLGDIVCNITKRSELENALRTVRDRAGTPTILINNAGIDSPPDADASENGPFETYPEASLDRVIDVNLKGTFLTCQVFGGAMAECGKGSIINIASTYGLVSPNQDLYEYRRQNGEAWFKPAAYSASKSALFNLTRYLATYWAKKGVRVNTLTPGGIFNGQDGRFLTEYEKRVPMGRMAKPDEMNGALLFLASQSSSYVTGSNLVVDGGLTAW